MNSLTLNTPASRAADRRRILVVEDDEDIRSLLSKYLGDNGFEVMLARDGKQMDEVLANAQVDLIVLDVNLPDEDGFSICMRLRNTGSPPLIMLTARGKTRTVYLESNSAPTTIWSNLSFRENCSRASGPSSGGLLRTLNRPRNLEPTAFLVSSWTLPHGAYWVRPAYG